MTNKSFIKVCFYILAISFLASCKVKRPESVLSEDKMEDILYDYHIAKALGENLPFDEKYKKPTYYEAVFNKNHVSQEHFDSSMVWYTRNIKVLSEIYKNVAERLSVEQKHINQLVAIREKKTVVSEPGDSIDVWTWQHVIPLTNMPALNKYTFILPSDSNFHERDTLKWSADFCFLNTNPSDKKVAEISMQIMYENDSTVQTEKSITKDGRYVVCLQSDTLGKLKSIRGSIYFASSTDSIKSLLVHHITLDRIHAKDTIPNKHKTELLDTDSLTSDTIKADSILKSKNDTITNNKLKN